MWRCRSGRRGCLSPSAGRILRWQCRLLDLRLPKEEAGRDGQVVLLRVCAAALSAVALYFLAPVGPELKRALMLVAFAPIASCGPVLALHCGYQGSRVAVINSMYLLVSIVCMSGLTVLLY